MFDVGLLFGMLDLSSFDQSCHFVLQLSHRCPVPSVFEFFIESFHLNNWDLSKLTYVYNRGDTIHAVSRWSLIKEVKPSPYATGVPKT